MSERRLQPLPQAVPASAATQSLPPPKKKSSRLRSCDAIRRAFLHESDHPLILPNLGVTSGLHCLHTFFPPFFVLLQGARRVSWGCCYTRSGRSRAPSRSPLTRRRYRLASGRSSRTSARSSLPRPRSSNRGPEHPSGKKSFLRRGG